MYPRSKDRWGHEIFWALNESYNDEKGDYGVGPFITAWVPTDWLTPESEDVPSLGLYYNGSSGSKTNEVGKQVSKAVKKLPPKCTRVDKIEDESFTCIRRPLQELSAAALSKPETLKANLIGNL